MAATPVAIPVVLMALALVEVTVCTQVAEAEVLTIVIPAAPAVMALSGLSTAHTIQAAVAVVLTTTLGRLAV
jgi:hypothetical protein